MDERGARDSPSRPGRASRSGSGSLLDAPPSNRARRQGAPPSFPAATGRAARTQRQRRLRRRCGDAMDIPVHACVSACVRECGLRGCDGHPRGPHWRRRRRCDGHGGALGASERGRRAHRLFRGGGSVRADDGVSTARVSAGVSAVRTADGKRASQEDAAPSAAMPAR